MLRSHCLGSWPNLSAASGGDKTVTLPTGRVLTLDNIRLDEGTQRFWYQTVDVTAYLTPNQRKLFPGWDIERYNLELHHQHAAQTGLDPNSGGETSIWTLFGNNVAGTLNSIGSAAPGALSSTAKIVMAAAVIYGLYVFSKRK